MAMNAKINKKRSMSVWLKVTLGLVAVVIAATVISLSVLLTNRINALRTAPQDSAQWNISRLEIDFLKLRNAVLLADAGETGLDEVRLRFDIFFSRVNILKKSQSVKWVLKTAAEKEKFLQLTDFLDRNVSLIDSPDPVLLARMGELRAQVDQISDIPTRLSLDSIELMATRSDAKRLEIIRIMESIALTLMALFLALGIAIFILRSQKRRLNATTSEIGRANTRLASSLRASLDAIVVVTEDGRIIDFNGSAEQVFGCSRAKVIGWNFFDTFVPDRLRESYRQRVRNWRDGTSPSRIDAGRFQIFGRNWQGHEMPMEISIGSATGEEGQIFIAYLRDITKDIEKEDQLLVARDEALSAYKEKSRFIAVMSHEMRTPLNGMVSALDLLRETKLDDEQSDILKAAETSAEILIGHVNDVLDIERIESSVSPDDVTPVDIDPLLSGVVGTLKAMADAQETTLKTLRDGAAIDTVRTDRRAIQQVLLNLVGNAIKFSPGGTVTLGLTVMETGPDTARLDFSVTDNGKGIEAADIERIFEDFVTVDSSYERQQQGTGLGLGIARRLVDRLGGTLHCESAPNVGSVFSFSVDVATKDGAPAQEAQTPDDGAQTDEIGQFSILLVDDNAINRDLLHRILANRDQLVDEARDGLEAVRMASKKRYDMILMDISMPNLDGLRACEMIRRHGSLSRQTPIYAVTSHALSQDRRRFQNAGMDGTLTKPIRSGDVEALLRSFQAGNRKAAAITRAPKRKTALQKDAGQLPLIDDLQIADLILVFGDQMPQKTEDFIEMFSDDMRDLSPGSPLNEIQKKVHEMAGIAAAFASPRLHAKLGEIETACKTDKPELARSILDNELAAVWALTKAALEQAISDQAKAV